MINYFEEKIFLYFELVRKAYGNVYELCDVIASIGALETDCNSELIQYENKKDDWFTSEEYKLYKEKLDYLDRCSTIIFHLLNYAKYKMFKMYNNM